METKDGRQVFYVIMRKEWRNWLQENGQTEKSVTSKCKKSKWSKTNSERVERMIAQGLMTKQGQQLIDFMKEIGKWEVTE